MEAACSQQTICLSEALRLSGLSQAELARRALAPPEPTGEIPEAAKPSVQLQGTMSYSYRDARPTPPDRAWVSALSGEALGFDVDFQSIRRDLDGVFDHDQTRLNLTRDGLFLGAFDQYTDLYPLRGQSQRFNGLKARQSWDRASATTLLGGEVETFASSPQGSVKYLGRLYEARQELSPLDWLRLKSGVLFLEHEADLPERSGTTDLPRRNLVSYGGLELPLWQDLSVSAQAARAAYAPDNAPGESVEDWDWRVASSLRRTRYHLNAVYEFVGDRYASLGNPVTYRDYAGWNLLGTFQVSDHWSVSGSWLRFNNNVDDDPSKITQDTQALTASSTFQLPGEQTLNLSFSDFLTDPSGPDPGSSSRSKLYRTDYVLPFLWDSRLLVNYQFTRTSQPAASDSEVHGAGGSLFKTFDGGSSVFLSQQFNQAVLKAGPDTFDASTSLFANYQLNPRLSFYLSPSYTRSATEDTRGIDTISGGVGWRAQLSPERAFTSELRLDGYDLDQDLGHSPKNWSYFVLFSQQFGISTQPNFGAIEGRVIRDANGNGQWDPGELGLTEARLLLDEEREVVTDATGRFQFTRLVPGAHTVTLDLGSVPPAWAIVSTRQRLIVGRRKLLRVLFPLLEAVSIRGRVFVDGNHDGVFQETEEPLEGIAVVVQPIDQFRRTDEEGEFLFEHLLPGTYTVQLHLEDLPTGYGLSSAAEIPVELPPGKEAAGLVFTVELLQEPIGAQGKH